MLRGVLGHDRASRELAGLLNDLSVLRGGRGEAEQQIYSGARGGQVPGEGHRLRWGESFWTAAQGEPTTSTISLFPGQSFGKIAMRFQRHFVFSELLP